MKEELEEQKKTEAKSDFLATTQVIIIGITIITCLMGMVFRNYILFGITIGFATITCITLNIFRVIIDLLQSIDEKLEKIKK